MTLVYYDGSCGYCNRVVKWLIKNKISRSIQFAKLDGKYGDQFFKIHPELKNIDSIIVANGTDVFIKSNAAIFLLKQIRKYKLLGLLLQIIPTPIRDIIYDYIAKIRHKIQTKQHCTIPTKQERKYFLD